MAIDSWPYRFGGLPLVARQDAAQEMYEHELDYVKIEEILETGDATGFDRREGVVERASMHRDRWIKVVVERVHDTYFGTEVWRIRHVGPDTHRR